MGEPKEVDLTRSHGNAFGSYGVVYANDLAKAEMLKEQPVYPVGSIVVREKFPTEDLETPEVVIAMVKREAGFSSDTGDWEFFVFEGDDFALRSRETKGSCAECHTKVSAADWVFRDYLKKTGAEAQPQGY